MNTTNNAYPTCFDNTGYANGPSTKVRMTRNEREKQRISNLFRQPRRPSTNARNKADPTCFQQEKGAQPVYGCRRYRVRWNPIVPLWAYGVRWKCSGYPVGKIWCNPENYDVSYYDKFDCDGPQIISRDPRSQQSIWELSPGVPATTETIIQNITEPRLL
jgi:hypothetical protein